MQRKAEMKTREKIVEDYRYADRVKRDMMWIRYIELRETFSEIDSDISTR